LITARGSVAKWAQLVGFHRERIFALARRLFERGSLSGGEVRSLWLQSR